MNKNDVLVASAVLLFFLISLSGVLVEEKIKSDLVGTCLEAGHQIKECQKLI